MEFKIFCPKCGKQTVIESIGNAYGGGLSIRSRCNNCNIYVYDEKCFDNERIVVRNNNIQCKNKNDNKYITKLELLEDDIGKEYINLKKKIGDRWVEVSFYINNIDFNREDIEPYNIPFVIHRYKDTVTFDLKEIETTDIPKIMTKDEIEKELGYKIDIKN